MLHIIRFILTPAAAITGFYVAMVIGILAYGIAETFYPPESFVSGACTADSWPIVEKSVLVTSAALAAILSITFASIMAPREKQITRWITLSIGGACALILATASGGAWIEFAAAIFAGFITLRLLPPEGHRPMQPNQPLE